MMNLTLYLYFWRTYLSLHKFAIPNGILKITPFRHALSSVISTCQILDKSDKQIGQKP